MAAPSVTYTFANSTTSDATQVNQNFTDIINGLSDGTKDLTVNAITANSTVTYNSAVILGASAANDLTVNASLASDVPIKTNTTYNFGSSTKGLLAVYLGGTSTFTIALKSATLSASYTLTLPSSGGTTGQFPVTDGSGSLSFRYIEKALAIQTSDPTLTGSETFIPCNASGGAFALALPAAATFTGKKYTFFRTDQTLANTVTLNRAGSDTITNSDGTTGATSITLATKGEQVEIISAGSTNIWYVKRASPSFWTTYTPAWTTDGTAPAVGNGTITGQWCRLGANARIRVFLKMGTSTTFGTGNFFFSVPITIDTAQLLSTSGQNGMAFGEANGFISGSGNFVGVVTYGSTTTVNVCGPTAALASNPWNSAQPGSWNANASTVIALDFVVPVSGWVG